MNIHLRYFAIVREALGRSEETRQVPEGATAGDVFDDVLKEAGRLESIKRSVMLMVNQGYVKPDYVLSDGDELAIIPPVSGGADRHFRVTQSEIDPRAVEALVSDDRSGAIVTFIGAVRNNARGRAVTALDYEAYPPAAEKMLQQIGAEIGDRWGLANVAIVHRYGLLNIGETSVVISVSAPHRDAAFEASRYAIERIKEIVPIWKKEHYDDGEVWIGSEADYQREIGRSPVTS